MGKGREYLEKIRNSSSGASTGLEAIDESNGIGWRLVGRDASRYGNIGDGAVDFSFSDIFDDYGALGVKSFAVGNYTKASGGGSVAFGNFTDAKAIYSCVTGFKTTAGSPTGIGSFALGVVNTNESNTMFEVGIASPTLEAALNGFEVYGQWDAGDSYFSKNANWGAVVAPEMTNTIIDTFPTDRVLITKEYGDANYSPVATGLESVDEGNGIGWRLIGRNPTEFGTIGQDAVDISYSSGSSSVMGATGSNSFAGGYNSIASGSQSFAFGNTCEAAGTQDSVALGTVCKALSTAAVALGRNALATNSASIAVGAFVTSNNPNQLTVGHYNEATSLDTIFEIGIGKDQAFGTIVRHNALEVYGEWTGLATKNPNWGAVAAPEMTNTIIDDFPTDRVLVTKEYGDANYGGSSGTPIPTLSLETSVVNGTLASSIMVTAGFKTGWVTVYVKPIFTDGVSAGHCTFEIDIGAGTNTEMHCSAYIPSNFGTINGIWTQITFQWMVGRDLVVTVLYDESGNGVGGAIGVIQYQTP